MSPPRPLPRTSPPLLLTLLALLALLALSCGWQDDPAPAATVPAVPPGPSPELATPEIDPAPFPSDPLPASGDYADQAAQIMVRYPDLNAQELLNTPEVNPHLADALRGIGEDQELQDYINSTVETASKFQGLDAIPGTVKLNLDLTVYDDTRTHRMLAAVLTGEPRPVVNFLIDELDEASYEFIINEEELEASSNGISFEGIPIPTTPE
jgi:hypothetical protein